MSDTKLVRSVNHVSVSPVWHRFRRGLVIGGAISLYISHSAVTWFAGIGTTALLLLCFDYGRDVYRWWRA